MFAALLIICRETKYSNGKTKMLTHIYTHTEEVKVQVQRWKAVVCSNPMPLLTHDSHCTHKNTPQIFHTDSWTTQQLHTGMGMLLSVCLGSCMLCAQTPSPIAQSDTNQLHTPCQSTDSWLIDMLWLTHSNLNGEANRIQFKVSSCKRYLWAAVYEFILFWGKVSLLWIVIILLQQTVNLI